MKESHYSMLLRVSYLIIIWLLWDVFVYMFCWYCCVVLLFSLLFVLIALISAHRCTELRWRQRRGGVSAEWIKACLDVSSRSSPLFLFGGSRVTVVLQSVLYFDVIQWCVSSLSYLLVKRDWCREERTFCFSSVFSCREVRIVVPFIFFFIQERGLCCS